MNLAELMAQRTRVVSWYEVLPNGMIMMDGCIIGIDIALEQPTSDQLLLLLTDFPTT